MNHYVLLGVSPDATRATIRQAFRVLVRQYHPDAGTGAPVDRFREIIDAYETLSDPARRRAYDRSLGVPAVQQQMWSSEPQAWPFATEWLIPHTPRSAATRRYSASMRDVFLVEMFADDLFAMIDSLFSPLRRRW